MNSLVIRSATEADLPSIHEIYNFYVQTSTCTFQLHSPECGKTVYHADVSEGQALPRSSERGYDSLRSRTRQSAGSLEALLGLAGQSSTCFGQGLLLRLVQDRMR